MASTVFKKTGIGGDVSFNLTPMIDVTFQLIIFFILTSQIASEALAQVILAKPYEPQVIKTDEEMANKIIVNVVSAEKKKSEDPMMAGMAKEFSVNGQEIPIDDLDTLKRKIEEAYKASSDKKEFFVELRADKRVSYSEVMPVMVVSGEIGIMNMGLTALEETSNGGE